MADVLSLAIPNLSSPILVQYTRHDISFAISLDGTSKEQQDPKGCVCFYGDTLGGAEERKRSNINDQGSNGAP